MRKPDREMASEVLYLRWVVAHEILMRIADPVSSVFGIREKIPPLLCSTSGCYAVLFLTNSFPSLSLMPMNKVVPQGTMLHGSRIQCDMVRFGVILDFN